MIRFQNLNNLDEYLKKTEAENIYMKKINSIQVSFTTMLTSITNKFHYYDDEISSLNAHTYQLSTNMNGLVNTVNSIVSNTSSMDSLINSLSSSIGSVSSSVTSLNDSFTNYTSTVDILLSDVTSNTSLLSGNYDSLSNSFTTFRTSVNQEISNLWSAMSANNNYNFFKEFAKESQLLYKNMNNQHMCIDNEEFEFWSSRLSQYTMVNPNKLEYVFCSNVLSTTAVNGVNLGGEFSRLGIKIPGNSTATSYDDTIAQNWITATVSSVYLYQQYGWSNFNENNYIKCLQAYLCNSGIGADYNYISTNLNAETINLWNYQRNNNANLYSTFWLNDRVKMISGFPSNQIIHMDIRRRTNVNMNSLTITGYQQALNWYFHGPSENGWCLGPIKFPGDGYVTLFQAEDMRFSAYSLYVYLRSTDNHTRYTVTYNEAMDIQSSLRLQVNNNLFLQMPAHGITKPNLLMTVSNYNASNTYDFNSWSVNRHSFYNLNNINYNGNTVHGLTISNNSNTTLSNFTFGNNNVYDMLLSAPVPNVASFDNNSISTLAVSLLTGNAGISFGQNFRNTEIHLSCGNPNTFYSYNNPDATLICPQGRQKLDYFTAGVANFSAAPGIGVGVFSTLNVSAMNGIIPYQNGGWRYVWCNQFNLTNPDIFYENMLQQDEALFHCPFFQLGSTYNGTDVLNRAINLGNSVLSHMNVLVDNAPTTSVNLRLTGNHTSESVHPAFIQNQPYIVKVDIRGWHPSRIIGFDHNYLFNNVASGYSAVPDQKFTAIVDNTADWNAYKMFFNPFGTPDENRIILSTS